MMNIFRIELLFVAAIVVALMPITIVEGTSKSWGNFVEYSKSLNTTVEKYKSWDDYLERNQKSK